MEKQRLMKIANNLKNDPIHELKRTQSNYALFSNPSSPTPKRPIRVRRHSAKTTSKQGKKQTPVNSPIKDRHKEVLKSSLEDRLNAVEENMPRGLNELFKTKQKKDTPMTSPVRGRLSSAIHHQEAQNTTDTALLEVRIKAIEDKMPEILNDLFKTKAQSNDLETKMLHFQNDLELTKRAYSELIYHELSKNRAEALVIPDMKPSVEEMAVATESRGNTKLASTSKVPKHQHQGASFKAKIGMKKDAMTTRRTESRRKP